jgi:hypothetical protein
MLLSTSIRPHVPWPRITGFALQPFFDDPDIEEI